MDILHALELPNWILPLIIVVPIISIVFAIILGILISRQRKNPSTRTVNLSPGNSRDLESENSAKASYLYLVDRQGGTEQIGSLPASIGRSEENQVILKDNTVSAMHANIYFKYAFQAICIEDRNSLNGLYVNGLPSCKNILYDGAEITFGSAPLTFRDVGYIHPN